MLRKLRDLRKAAEAAEAAVAEQRECVKQASAQTIIDSERLSDQLEPCRSLLRRAGVRTALPTETPESVRRAINTNSNVRPLRLQHG